MKETIYIYMNPDATVDNIKDACVRALQAECAGICVPQWFVSLAAENMKGKKIATVAGLPGGTTSSLAKYAETKQAVANKASIIIESVNMDLCAAGDFSFAKSDLIASMAPAKKFAHSMALLDEAVLSKEQLLEAGKLCMEAGAEAVLLTGATEEGLRVLADAGVKVGTFGKNLIQGAELCMTSAL